MVCRRSVGSPGDGTSWGTAFKPVQEGMTAATDSDEVLVEEGTYTENIAFGDKNTAFRSTDPTDWTVINSTIIGGYSVVATVAFAGSENDTCVLSGFTIRNAEGTPSRGHLAAPCAGAQTRRQDVGLDALNRRTERCTYERKKCR